MITNCRKQEIIKSFYKGNKKCQDKTIRQNSQQQETRNKIKKPVTIKKQKSIILKMNTKSQYQEIKTNNM